MNKLVIAFILASGLFAQGSFASVATDHSSKEETTCGLVVQVDKAEQMVQMKPVSSAGLVENTIITRRVLPESISMAKLVKGHPRMKFCIQLPIAQGGKYKTWATAHKISKDRLSSM